MAQSRTKLFLVTIVTSSARVALDPRYVKFWTGENNKGK